VSDLSWGWSLAIRHLPLSLFVSLLAAACGSPGSQAALPINQLGGQLSSIDGGVNFAPAVADGLSSAIVGGNALSARALSAEFAFLFPDESQAVTRSLMRGEFARLEAERLGVVVPPAAIDAALERAMAEIVAGMGDVGDFTTWCVSRYGLPRADVVAAIRARLTDNLRYQLVMRMAAAVTPRVRVLVSLSRDQSAAEEQLGKLQMGANPLVFQPPAREELIPLFAGGELAAHLSAAEGNLCGPFRLDGDRLWHVVMIREELAAARHHPPLHVLLGDLRANPIGALETRSWWDEMHRRYTSWQTSPLIQSPLPTFVSD